MKKRIYFAFMALIAALMLTPACSKEPRQTGPDYIKHISDNSKSPLEDILKNYKGKVTLVNLWATWCHPCLQAHEDWKPLKEDAKYKDVKFVYVASPTSGAETWQEMIKDIKGDHYYITDEQMSSILDKIEAAGYPAFLVIGKDGSILYSCSGNRPEIIPKLEEAMQ